MESYEKNMRNFIQRKNEITIIKEQLKLKEQDLKEIEKQLLEYMEENNITCQKLSDNSNIEIKTVESHKPITLTFLKSFFNHYFDDKVLSEKIYNILYANREICKRTFLVRTNNKKSNI